MMPIDLAPLVLSGKLATVTTVLLLLFGLPVAVGIFRLRGAAKAVARSIVSMPLVLPPTVLGLYLLLAFGAGGAHGLRLAFTFPGLVIGSVIYSLPFMVNPVESALDSLPPSLMEASLTLGKSYLVTVFRVLLPNVRRAIAAGAVMTFAHTLGEFGVVLMIGGNIPGRTRVASIAIYDSVESLAFREANVYALILVALSFLALTALHLAERRGDRRSL